MIELPGTDFSVAYADQPGGGALRVQIDGADTLRAPTDVPFTTAAGEPLFMENRRGVRGPPTASTRSVVTADGGPVALLGVFAYDTRANRSHERAPRGTAYPGETVAFTRPFSATARDLHRRSPAPAAGVTVNGVTFRGTGPGSYQIIGERPSRGSSVNHQQGAVHGIRRQPAFLVTPGDLFGLEPLRVAVYEGKILAAVVDEGGIVAARGIPGLKLPSFSVRLSSTSMIISAGATTIASLWIERRFTNA